MKLVETAIPAVKLVIAQRHGDARGFFAETWQQARYAAAGIADRFVQDNEGFNREAGTVRGLHFQPAPRWQVKLVRAAHGRVFAVAVDLRRRSRTFARHVAAELSAAEGNQLYVPPGFAFGYCTLEPGCTVLYKVTEFYAPEHDRGVAWDDPEIAVAWPVDRARAILSDRDRAHKRLKDVPAAWLYDGPTA
jgi:dTDP-4-dehydrorhamnose 3,5-epimerase